ncbi:MAG: S-adenosylmethionine:tRNA ribosyltransferase-isomerase, partial [Muribaculaceae bacterium]|nr:S-adenosylmethionine:tRNA ribosyltransferase-isomerase [Muribaculaceae bacterium]
MNPRQINIDQFDYPLPDERIAKSPLAERDRCRLLVH